MKTIPTVKDRNYYEARYNSARLWLLIAIIVTGVDVLLTAIGSETVLTFCAIGPVILISTAITGLQTPEYLLWLCSYLGIEMPDMSLVTPLAVILIAVAVLGILAYFFSWLSSKKDGRWMTVALVLFILDCLFLVGDMVLQYNIAKDFELEYSFDFLALVFHCWVLYDTGVGVHAWKKLKTMPQTVIEGNYEEPAEAPADAAEADGTVDPAPIDGEIATVTETSDPAPLTGEAATTDAEAAPLSPLAAAAAEAAEEDAGEDDDDGDEI